MFANCDNIITKNTLYCKVTDEKYPLFYNLLTRMPTQIISSNSKADFAKQQRIKNNIALLNYKWIFYNENKVWHLMFDIDKKYKFEEIKDFLNEKFGLIPTWLCETDKGIQFGFMLTNVLKSEEQIKLAREAKTIITKFLYKKFDGVDVGASNRIRGFWRNPLLHKYEYTGNFIELKTLKLKVLIPYTPKPEFKKKTKIQKIKEFPKPKLSLKDKKTIRIDYPGGVYKIVELADNLYLADTDFSIGNRNNAIFYNLMANFNSGDFDEIYAVAEALNQQCEEQLEEKELKHIVDEVIMYNRENKNYVFGKYIKNKILKVRTYNENWEVGKMGFEKISNLNYAEYLEEVRRRQSEAGKEIGVNNLKKANEKRANEAKQKVYKAIEQLKAKDEKVTILKVVELAKVSKSSASKYIKQAKEEGII